VIRPGFPWWVVAFDAFERGRMKDEENAQKGGLTRGSEGGSHAKITQIADKIGNL